MLQKKKYITPTTRFASITRIKDLSPYKSKWFYKLKKRLFTHRKIFSKSPILAAILTRNLTPGSVTVNHHYNKKPYQLFISTLNLHNKNIILPGIDQLVPGKKVFDLTLDIIITKINYLGAKSFLKDLPYYTFVTHIVNNTNTKLTFVKSSGTFGIKLKGKKTVKLILIKLPSGKIYFFFKKTICFIGKNFNFFNNKFIEGKWGTSIHKAKQLAVRGVAKNPVDHPNGGRTKAKQPEKSPWGWIAKHNK